MPRTDATRAAPGRYRAATATTTSRYSIATSVVCRRGRSRKHTAVVRPTRMTALAYSRSGYAACATGPVSVGAHPEGTSGRHQDSIRIRGWRVTRPVASATIGFTRNPCHGAVDVLDAT